MREIRQKDKKRGQVDAGSRGERMSCYDECVLCDSPVPAHDSGLCLRCEEGLLEFPENLAEAEKSWLEAEKQGIQKALRKPVSRLETTHAAVMAVRR